MRGIWISSVANIDWPSKQGLSTEQIKTEAIEILDNVTRLGFNCIFLQVRPSSDALYRSSFEPWSSYLTGIQGQAPDDGFDPLQFWTEEAHRRGIELHAWINPFRATTGKNQETAPNHITKTHPEWIIYYDDKGYIDPGNSMAREYICSIIADIATNYDIDGIHIDDYFYPYPSPNKAFADTASFRKHNPSNQPLQQWRRNNINTFVRQAHTTVHNIKPWLVFGASPFGVWRNKKDDSRGSSTTAGTTAYDNLNADILAWMDNGWIDYVVPQIYWESSHPTAGFDTLIEWWSKQEGCPIFIGHGIYKINNGTPAWNNAAEMPNQLNLARKTAGIQGSVMFSYKQFNRDLLGLDTFLLNQHYKTKALVPQMGNEKKENIKIDRIKKKKNILIWDVTGEPDIRFYVIYRYRQKKDSESADAGHIWKITSEKKTDTANEDKKYYYRIAPVDKFRQEHELSKRIKAK